MIETQTGPTQQNQWIYPTKRAVANKVPSKRAPNGFQTGSKRAPNGPQPGPNRAHKRTHQTAEQAANGLKQQHRSDDNI